MRTTSPRRLAGALAASALLLSLASCGDDKADTTAADPSATTSTSTPTEPTESATTGHEIDATEFAADIERASSQLTTARIAMTVSAEGAVISADGQVDYRGASPEMALSMSSQAFGDATIDMRLVDKVMYMKLPMIDGGDKFYKIDLSDPNNPLGSSLGQMDSFDPKSTFGSFTAGLQKVVEIGTEDVEGEELTHYVLTTDTAELKKTLPRAEAKQLPATLTYDVWLDSDNQLRKMVAEMPGSGAITIELSHLGEPVDIKAPPAKQVATFPTQ